MSAHPAADPHYEPPWLVHLRDVDPDSAQYFDQNYGRVTRLDLLLGGISDVDTKIATVRSCIQLGMDPDDPAIIFTITALGLNKLIGADFQGLIKDAKTATEAARLIVEKIQAAATSVQLAIEQSLDRVSEELESLVDQSLKHIESSSQTSVAKIGETTERSITAITLHTSQIVGATADIKETMAALPQAVAEISTKLEAQAIEIINTEGGKYAALTVANAAKAYSDQTLAQLKDVQSQVSAVHEAMKPVRVLAERLKTGTESVILGMKITARERRAGLTGILVGSLAGITLYGFLANVTLIGLGPDLSRDARAGRFYLESFAAISNSCRGEFAALARRQ